MPSFSPQDPAFDQRVRTSFDHQSLNHTIGARLTKVAAGDVEIEVPFREGLGQQHGFMHGGIVSAIVDSAGGYAALSLTPPGSEVLTVEFKINFVAPAKGERIVARGRVTKPGRTLTVCAGDVFAVDRGEERLVATMLQTMMTVTPQPPAHIPSAEASDIAAHVHPGGAPTETSRGWCPCRLGSRLRRTFRAGDRITLT